MLACPLHTVIEFSTAIAAASPHLLGDEAAPVSPVWGSLNALLNGLTLIGVALIYRSRR